MRNQWSGEAPQGCMSQSMCSGNSEPPQRRVGRAEPESLASPSSSFHLSGKQPGMVETAQNREPQVLSADPQSLGGDTCPPWVSGSLFVKWGWWYLPRGLVTGSKSRSTSSGNPKVVRLHRVLPRESLPKRDKPWKFPRTHPPGIKWDYILNEIFPGTGEHFLDTL